MPARMGSATHGFGGTFGLTAPPMRPACLCGAQATARPSSATSASLLRATSKVRAVPSWHLPPLHVIPPLPPPPFRTVSFPLRRVFSSPRTPAPRLLACFLLACLVAPHTSHICPPPPPLSQHTHSLASHPAPAALRVSFAAVDEDQDGKLNRAEVAAGLAGVFFACPKSACVYRCCAGGARRMRDHVDRADAASEAFDYESFRRLYLDLPEVRRQAASSVPTRARKLCCHARVLQKQRRPTRAAGRLSYAQPGVSEPRSAWLPRVLKTSPSPCGAALSHGVCMLRALLQPLPAPLALHRRSRIASPSTLRLRHRQSGATRAAASSTTTPSTARPPSGVTSSRAPRQAPSRAPRRPRSRL